MPGGLARGSVGAWRRQETRGTPFASLTLGTRDTAVNGIKAGRGALGGPVSVGAVVVDARTRSLTGVRDSKQLSPRSREQLEPRIRDWAVSAAVGHASPQEIDGHGIIAALALAGRRALAALSVRPGIVLLDGSHDWLGESGQGSLWGDPEAELPPVHTRVKADVSCTSVAAASVLAKVERDRLMVQWHELHPAYDWISNKGYSSPVHLEALRRVGPSAQHRRSWNLPGVS